jgi:mono/diheme cytochrome c family protein
MNKRINIILFSFSILLLSGCGFSLAGDIKPPADYVPPAALPPAATAVAYPLIPPDPAHGEKIYIEHCASCHGSQGNGAGANAGNSSSPSALSQSDTLHNAVPQEWFDAITNGMPNTSMPGFSTKLDDRSTWDVISYLLSLENSPDQMAVGLDIYMSICSQCHGENGRGEGVKASSFVQKPADFTNQSVMAAISNLDMVNILTSGLGESMPAFGNMLGDPEKWAVVGYVRSLTFKPVQLAATQPASINTVVVPSELPTETPSAPEPVTVDGSGLRVVDVTGQVINDSGSLLPSGMLVSLRFFDEMQETASKTSEVNKDGSYEFNDVEMPVGRIFVASVEFGGQVFSSQPSMHPGGEIDETQTVINLPIHVYESTTEKSVVSADRMHIFFDFSNPGIVQVVELFLISNHSSQVLVEEAPGKGVLEFNLPVGSENLQFQDSVIGDRYLKTGNGFADTIPVKPGEATHQVLFAYDLPYLKKLQINLQVPMDAEMISVMIPVDGIKLRSNQLIDDGVRTNQGMNFRLFTATNIPSGTDLEISLSGNIPGQESAASSLKINPVLFGGGILLLAVSGVGLYLYQNQKRQPITEPDDENGNLTDKESVMDAIIALDSLHKEGKLKDDVYKSRREELKNILKGLM